MSQLSRFAWTEPVLCHYNYDIKKPWFVYFDFTDRLTLTTVRKQFRGDLHKFKTVEKRKARAKELIAYWKQELREGWNPLIKSDVHKLPYNYKVSEAFTQVLKLHLPSLKKKSQRNLYLCQQKVSRMGKGKPLRYVHERVYALHGIRIHGLFNHRL